MKFCIGRHLQSLQSPKSSQGRVSMLGVDYLCISLFSDGHCTGSSTALGGCNTANGKYLSLRVPQHPHVPPLSCSTWWKGCHVPQCLSRSTEGGRSPWQLGRTSRSCFENICVFDLKMIQSKLHNLCKIYIENKSLEGLLYDEKYFIFFLQFLVRARRKPCSGFPSRGRAGALCCQSALRCKCTTQTHQGAGQELMEITGDRKRPEWPELTF